MHEGFCSCCFCPKWHMPSLSRVLGHCCGEDGVREMCAFSTGTEGTLSLLGLHTRFTPCSLCSCITTGSCSLTSPCLQAGILFGSWLLEPCVVSVFVLCLCTFYTGPWPSSSFCRISTVVSQFSLAEQRMIHEPGNTQNHKKFGQLQPAV